jgi:GNAT superfamily N-acetyltransferase
VIRPATPQDIRPCAELLVRAWHRAYGDFIAAADMPTVQERVARLEEQAVDDLDVFEQDGRVAGVVRVTKQTGEPGVGELQVLYVEPAAQGAGIGTRLHDHGLDRLRAAGCVEAMLWVWSANGHGRDFYAARGWRPDGATGTWLDTLAIRLRRPL